MLVLLPVCGTSPSQIYHSTALLYELIDANAMGMLEMWLSSCRLVQRLLTLTGRGVFVTVRKKPRKCLNVDKPHVRKDIIDTEESEIICVNSKMWNRI